MTPEARSAASAVLPLARELHEALSKFRADHPKIVDYRIEESHQDAARIVRLLTYLDIGEDPVYDAAFARFAARYRTDDRP